MEYTLQKIKKVYDDDMDLAIKYFTVLSVVNNIHLTRRKIQLLAFTALRGSISAGGAREEFVSKVKSSKATVNNMIAELQEMGLMVKINNKIIVNPKINLDFSKPLLLSLNLSVKNAAGSV